MSKIGEKIIREYVNCIEQAKKHEPFFVILDDIETKLREWAKNKNENQEVNTHSITCAWYETDYQTIYIGGQHFKNDMTEVARLLGSFGFKIKSRDISDASNLRIAFARNIDLGGDTIIEVKIAVYFSYMNGVCQQRQVGEKIVPIYETVCPGKEEFDNDLV